MMRYLTRPKAKPMPITKYIDTMNRLYGNEGGAVKKAESPHGTEPDYYPPKEMEDIKKSLNVSEMVKKEERFNDKILKRDKYEEKKVAGIKDTALYKLLENPKVLGVELGHDTILQIMNLIQGSGIVKKPREKSVKIAVVKEPKKEIDHIALLSNGDEFIV